MMRVSKRPAGAVLVLMATVLTVTGCGAVSSGDVQLGVPFHAQAVGSQDCGPASVQMWADYDYYAAPPTQAEISQWMGGSTWGVSEQTIADAVNHYTRTGDAIVDYEGRIDADRFMAKQITSIDNYAPVIAIVDFNHAVVVNGGQWRQEGSWYQWNYTYFHDARKYGNRRFGSAEWIDHNCPPNQATCVQIISQIMTEGYIQNLNSYGDQVYDSSGCASSGGCTAENQY